MKCFANSQMNTKHWQKYDHLPLTFQLKMKMPFICITEVTITKMKWKKIVKLLHNRQQHSVIEMLNKTSLSSSAVTERTGCHRWAVKSNVFQHLKLSHNTSLQREEKHTHHAQNGQVMVNKANASTPSAQNENHWKKQRSTLTVKPCIHPQVSQQAQFFQISPLGQTLDQNLKEIYWTHADKNTFPLIFLKRKK